MSEDQCATKCYSMTVFNLFDISQSQGKKGLFYVVKVLNK